MKRILALILGLIASPLFGQTTVSGSGGGVSSGSSVSGCTAFSIVYIDTSGNLACASTPINGSVTTAARSILTIRDTITGASATSNFLNITGSMPSTLSAVTSGLYLTIAGDNDVQQQNGIKSLITGTGAGAAATSAIWGETQSTGSTTVGVWGQSSGASTIATGVYGLGSAGTSRMGGYFTLTLSNPPATIAALVADNVAVASPIAVFADNSTLTSTTGATANITVIDGAQMRLGNMGLTSATMTPTIVAEARTVTHSYAWTNAMVTALGAVATGDITVATLPAKTQVNNAYVVIDTAANQATTLTVSCGDAIAGTPFINYVVASDAKAAANTVYGDAVAERGTSIDVEFYYVPSYTATTLVTCHFIAGTTLNTVTSSTGRLILTTTLLP